MIFIIIGIKNFIFFETKCFDVKNDQVFFIMESVWEENKQFYRNFIFVIFARSFVRNFTLRIQNTELCFCCSCIGNLTGFFKQLILPMMNFFFVLYVFFYLLIFRVALNSARNSNWKQISISPPDVTDVIYFFFHVRQQINYSIDVVLLSFWHHVDNAQKYTRNRENNRFIFFPLRWIFHFLFQENKIPFSIVSLSTY